MSYDTGFLIGLKASAHPRRHGRLSLRSARCSRSRAARGLRLLLVQRVQGDAGLPHASSRRSSGFRFAPRTLRKTRRKAEVVPSSRALLAAFVAFIAAAPFMLFQFHVALLNYIALATIIAWGLCCSPAWRASCPRPAGVRRHRRVHHRGGRHAVRRIAVGFRLVLALGLAAVVALFLGAGACASRVTTCRSPPWRGASPYFMFGNLEMLGKYTGISDVPRLRRAARRLRLGRNARPARSHRPTCSIRASDAPFGRCASAP